MEQAQQRQVDKGTNIKVSLRIEDDIIHEKKFNK